MRNVILSVNGSEYSGWNTIQITNSIESFVGSFSMSVSERWNGNSKPWPILEGDECTVKLGNDVLITGYVDSRAMSLSDSDHTFEVAGRDKAADLIDCSAVLSAWEFSNVGILEICNKVASPFGVKVAFGPGISAPSVPPYVVINPGESAFDVIERAARLAGLFAMSDGKGGVLLTKAGKVAAATPLIEGVNTKEISCQYESASTYRKYIVIGQQQGSDEIFGEAAADVRAEAQDMNVKRAARVLLLQAEGSATIRQAQDRASWEASVRRARACSVQVKVQGWEQRTGQIWRVNSPVQLDASFIGIKGEMLISEVTYLLSESEGTVTQLTLRLPGAFDPEPLIPDNPKDTVQNFEE